MGKIRRPLRKIPSSQPASLPTAPIGLFSFGKKSAKDFIVGDVRERATRSLSKVTSTESEAESPAKTSGRNQKEGNNPFKNPGGKPKKKKQKSASLLDTNQAQAAVPIKKQRTTQPSKNVPGGSDPGPSRNSGSDEMSFGDQRSSTSGKVSTSNAKRTSKISVSTGRITKPSSKPSLATSSDSVLTESELRKKNKSASLSSKRQRHIAKKKFDQIVPPNQRFDQSTLSQASIAGPSRVASAPRIVPGLQSFTPLGGNTDLSEVEDDIPVVNRKGKNARQASVKSNGNTDSRNGTETPQSAVTASTADLTPPPEFDGIESEYDGVHLKCLLDQDIESHRQLANHDDDRYMIPLLAKAPVKIDCTEHEEYPGVRQQGIWVQENCQTGNFFIAAKTFKPMERTSKSILLHVTKGPIVVRSVRFGFDLTSGEPHLLPDIYNTGDYVLISKGGAWSVDNPSDEEISFHYTFCS